MKIIEGNLQAKDCKIAIIASRFNDFITSKLIDGAEDCFIRHGGISDNLTLYWVPGAYEIPVLLEKIINDSKEYDGFVCLGAVIRGATPHFDFVASEVAKGIAQISIKRQIPVSFGVLTTDNIEQAIERAGSKSGNKGWESMLSIIEMVDLFKK